MEHTELTVEDAQIEIDLEGKTDEAGSEPKSPLGGNAAPKSYGEVYAALRDTLGVCWQYSSGHRPYFFFAYGMTLLIEVASIVAPWLISKLTQRIAGHPIGLRWEDVGYILAGVWACWLSWGLLGGVRNAFNQRFRNDLNRDLPLRALRRLLSLSRAFHLRNNTGQLTAKIVRGATAVTQVIDLLQYNALPRLTMFVIVVGLLARLSPYFLLMSLSLIVIYVFLVIHGRTRTQKLYDDANDLEENAEAYASEAVTNVAAVQAFNQEEAVMQKSLLMRETAHGYLMREARMNLKTRSALAMVADQIGWCMLVLAVWMFYKRQLSFQVLVFTMTLINRFRDEIVHFGWMYDYLTDLMSGVRRFAFILTQQPTVADPAEPQALPVSGAAEVIFEDVGYKYDAEGKSEEAPWALQNVSLRIAPGTVMGVTGDSGGGKSTLIGLILQFAHPTAGRILFNGVDIRQVAKRDVRAQIGYVEQNVKLFNDTVAKNILMGRKATKAEIIAAAKVAGAHDYIMRLPKGYNTLIGERGARLSGGQQQRLGIARAVLKRPAFMVFDEPASSLDAKSIEHFTDALRRVKAEGMCTMIVITHQLAFLQDIADEIAIVRQGRIAETGTHEQLLAHNGFYSEIVSLQQHADRRRQLEA